MPTLLQTKTPRHHNSTTLGFTVLWPHQHHRVHLPKHNHIMHHCFKLLAMATVLHLALQGQAQNAPVFKPNGDSSLPDVLISSTKFPEKVRNVVQKVQVITSADIARTNAQNTGDLLQSTGNIFVQKSQQGGSSPVLRGFEASRVLLMVDGIRMNNAIYRSGHLQNVITIDQNMLERAEVMYGPGSTLHGSDAMGGVVAFKTRDPKLSTTGKVLVTGTAFGRFSSVNNEQTGHLHTSVGGKKWAVLLSATHSSFDDLKMGNKYPSKYPNFGRRVQYVQRINGRDSIVTNPDDRVQKFSGYTQWDVTGKLLFQQNKNMRHLLNVQVSNSNNIPRYDRLQDRRNGNLRFAEWYYGPQKRNLYAYTLEANLRGFFNALRITASHQQIEESRFQRERNNLLRQSRIENVNVSGLTADLHKLWGQNELSTGIDVQLNQVASKAYTQNINTGIRGPLDTRYPEKNIFNTYAIYAQHLYKFKSNKLVLNNGLRLQASNLRSTVVDKTIAFRPFDRIAQNPVGISGNLGLVIIPTGRWRITTGIATGFRTPNIDDLSKIFETSTASRQLVVPNPNIKPEKTITPELGITRHFGTRVKLEGSIFYTWFRDAIIKDKFPINGQDSSRFEGIMYQTLASQNNAKAQLWGYNIGLTITPAKGWQLFSTITYTKGTFTRPGGIQVPLDHIPPMFGKTSLRYTANRFSAEFWSMYNGWKKIADYNPDGEDNAQYATPDGMPAWATINLRGQYNITKVLQLQMALENITDRNYRQFASGFSAPGRNVMVALRAVF
ncbi:MAG: TonB-dependent receptor [Bacteroidetes bacterium]|nr:MAG: TonB-dependent receptor [Bacteroidota bacterium]